MCIRDSATTVWLYRERLAKAGVVEKLFGMFDAFLRERGCQAMGGQIIDASIVPVPTQRNSKEENAEIKAGDIPGGWVEGSANKLARKDLDARAHIGLRNLAYNMRRFTHLENAAPATA